MSLQCGIRVRFFESFISVDGSTTERILSGPFRVGAGDTTSNERFLSLTTVKISFRGDESLSLSIVVEFLFLLTIGTPLSREPTTNISSLLLLFSRLSGTIKGLFGFLSTVTLSFPLLLFPSNDGIVDDEIIDFSLMALLTIVSTAITVLSLFNNINETLSSFSTLSLISTLDELKFSELLTWICAFAEIL